MKAKRAVILIALAFTFANCTIEPRPNFMPNNETMAMLLSEIHIGESMLRMGYIRTKETIKPYYRRTLQKYNLNTEQFDSCITWLSHNRREYEKIYELVMHRLRASKAEQNNTERKRAILNSRWRNFGKKEVDTSESSDYWIRLDEINSCLLPADLSDDYSGGGSDVK